jgi:hypothetical protein
MNGMNGHKIATLGGIERLILIIYGNSGTSSTNS